MIIKLGKVVIDTSLDHEAHKKEIDSKTTFFCYDDQPIQWFTQPSPEAKGKDRFFHLKYNKEGSELKKITSFDYIGHGKKMVRKRKIVDGECYFSKNKPQESCDVYEMVEETDFSTPVSINDKTWWKEGWTEPAHQALPITTGKIYESMPRKKRWGLF